jgi:hypothetical protein
MTGNLSMPGSKGMMTNMAKRFLRSTWAEGISELIAAVERDLTASVSDLIAAADADHHLDVPDADQRAEQLREGVLAIIEGNLREHYIREHADVAKADRVAQLVALDDDEWKDRRDGWVEAYQANGTEKEAEDIVTEHLLRKYALTTQEIEDLREWSDEMEANAMRTVLVGNVEAARETIESVTEEVQDGA